MLAKKYRFHGHGSLKYLHRNGKMIRSRVISLKYVPNKFNARPRISVIVSKKVLKLAVARNRARRRIYAAIQPKLQDFKANYDLAIIVSSPDILKNDFLEIDQLLTAQLREAGIID